MTQKLFSLVTLVLFSINVAAQGKLLYSGVYTSSDICTSYCMGNMQKGNITPFVYNISIYENTLKTTNSNYPFIGTQNVNGLTARIYGSNDSHYVVFSDYSMYQEQIMTILGMKSVSQVVYYKGNLLQGSAGGTNRGSQQSQGSSRQKQKVKCSLCNGWGRYLKEYASRYSGTKPDKWCEQCGQYDYAHYHKTCASCQGKGYVYK